MGHKLGAFNRKGQVAEGTADDAEHADVTPFAALHDRSDLDGTAETASDETAPADEEAEAVDADGDGHDDETGQFVDGNTEAADTPDESLDETPAETPDETPAEDAVEEEAE